MMFMNSWAMDPPTTMPRDSFMRLSASLAIAEGVRYLRARLNALARRGRWERGRRQDWLQGLVFRGKRGQHAQDGMSDAVREQEYLGVVRRGPSLEKELPGPDDLPLLAYFGQVRMRERRVAEGLQPLPLADAIDPRLEGTPDVAHLFAVLRKRSEVIPNLEELADGDERVAREEVEQFLIQHLSGIDVRRPRGGDRLVHPSLQDQRLLREHTEAPDVSVELRERLLGDWVERFAVSQGDLVVPLARVFMDDRSRGAWPRGQ